VKVEVYDSHSKNPVSSVMTDKEGAFSVPTVNGVSVYRLRLSLAAYDRLLITVKIKRTAPRELTLVLEPAM